jgi:hypothetical protein
MAWTARGSESVYRSVRRLRDGGVTILAGTDVGNLGTFQGYSLHRELELLVRAGLTNREALAAATTSAGEFLGKRYGVRPSDEANLLLLDASPLDDIANTQKIAAVIHHGVVVDRGDLLDGHAPALSPVLNTPLVDDFARNDLASPSGSRWKTDTDSLFGGTSTVTTEWRDGVLHVRGSLRPKKGMPSLAGISIALDSSGTAYDVSRFTGIRVRFASVTGPLMMKIITSGVTNYDYHAAVVPNTGESRQIDLPFSDFRQLWSTPVAWTGKDVQGIALWWSAFSPAEVSFAIDSIEFY